jgi:hypothetical protein
MLKLAADVLGSMGVFFGALFVVSLELFSVNQAPIFYLLMGLGLSVLAGFVRAFTRSGDRTNAATGGPVD